MNKFPALKDHLFFAFFFTSHITFLLFSIALYLHSLIIFNFSSRSFINGTLF